MARKFRSAMIALIAVATILTLPAASKATDTYTPVSQEPSGLAERSLTLVKGWSFFSFNFTPIVREPEQLFAGIDIKDKLYGFYPYSKEIENRAILYNDANKDKFGPVSQNLGYWINLDQETTLKYWGMDTYRKTGTWLHEGWNMIAYPYSTPQSVENIKIRSHEDGSEISFTEARHRNLVGMVMYGWTNDWQQGLFDLGLEEDYASTTEMQPNHAYWVEAVEEGYDIVINDPATL